MLKVVGFRVSYAQSKITYLESRNFRSTAREAASGSPSSLLIVKLNTPHPLITTLDPMTFEDVCTSKSMQRRTAIYS